MLPRTLSSSYGKLAAVVLFLLPTVVSAQNAPYDVFPAADPPYYRVRYEASTEPGELTFPVNYTVWIPEGVETLRGVVVHQHGCGEGSCKSGLTGVYDLHWQAAGEEARLRPAGSILRAASISRLPDVVRSAKRFRRRVSEVSDRPWKKVGTFRTGPACRGLCGDTAAVDTGPAEWCCCIPIELRPRGCVLACRC